MVDRYLLDGLAADLRSHLGADVSSWKNDNAKFKEQFDQVVQALKTGEVAREASSRT